MMNKLRKVIFFSSMIAIMTLGWSFNALAQQAIGNCNKFTPAGLCEISKNGERCDAVKDAKKQLECQWSACAGIPQQRCEQVALSMVGGLINSHDRTVGGLIMKHHHQMCLGNKNNSALGCVDN